MPPSDETKASVRLRNLVLNKRKETHIREGTIGQIHYPLLSPRLSLSPLPLTSLPRSPLSPPPHFRATVSVTSLPMLPSQPSSLLKGLTVFIHPKYSPLLLAAPCRGCGGTLRALSLLSSPPRVRTRTRTPIGLLSLSLSLAWHWHWPSPVMPGLST